MKKKTFLVIMCGLIFSLLIAFSAQAGKLSGKQVLIGGIYSVSGICNEFALAAKIGADIAIEEINEAGGIGGVPIKVVEYDVNCKGAPAIPIINKLVKQDKVLFVNGPCQSSVVEVIYPKLNRLKTVLCSFCSSKPGIASTSKYGFRNTLTSDKQLEPAIIKWKERYNIKTAVVLYNSEDAVSTVEGKILMPMLFKKHGIELLKMYSFQSNTFDFKPFMTKIKALNPDGIGMGTCHEHGARMAIEARKQGIEAPFIAGACNSSAAFLELAGDASKGYYGSTAAWIQGNPDPRMVNFLAKFLKRSPGGKIPPYSAPRSYDNIYILKKIMEEEGVTNKPGDLQEDRDKIQRGWAKLKDYNGISGITSIDENGDGIGGVVTLVEKDGKYISE